MLKFCSLRHSNDWKKGVFLADRPVVVCEKILRKAYPPFEIIFFMMYD